MIIAFVEYKIPAGKRDAFLQEMKDEGIIDACRAEEGSLRYEYFYPVDSETDLFLVEQYADRDAVNVHLAADYVKKVPDIKEKYGVETVMTSFRTE